MCGYKKFKNKFNSSPQTSLPTPTTFPTVRPAAGGYLPTVWRATSPRPNSFRRTFRSPEKAHTNVQIDLENYWGSHFSNTNTRLKVQKCAIEHPIQNDNFYAELKIAYRLAIRRRGTVNGRCGTLRNRFCNRFGKRGEDLAEDAVRTRNVYSNVLCKKYFNFLKIILYLYHILHLLVPMNEPGCKAYVWILFDSNSSL